MRPRAENRRADAHHAWRLPRWPPRSRGSCPSTARAARSAGNAVRDAAGRAARAGARNQGRASSGSSSTGGSSISPDEPGARREVGLEQGRHDRRRPRRTWSSSPARSTCTSSSGALPASAAARVDRREQVERVDRVNAVRTAAAAFRALFDCRWPIRCHRSGRSAGVGDLLQGFLHLVLAEVELPGGGGRAHAARRGRSSRRRRGESRRGRDRRARAACVEAAPHGRRGWPAISRLRINRPYFFSSRDELLHFLRVRPARGRAASRSRTR